VIVTHLPYRSIVRAIRRFESVFCPHEGISGEGLVRRRLYVLSIFYFLSSSLAVLCRVFALRKLNNILRDDLGE